MGLFSRLFPKVEERATYNGDATTQTVLNQAFSLDSLLNPDAITEDKILKIPTVKSCVDLITSTVASMPVYLYKENADGSIEKINDRRLRLLNHESNEFLNGYDLKKTIVKDLLLYGASYTSIIEGGNTILELHPVPAKSVVVNKKVVDGYRTVGAEIILSQTDGSFTNNKKAVVFKPYQLMIALKETYDGLSSVGVLKRGQDIFSQALNEMLYTNNLYEQGALPLGLLKTDSRLTEAQANSLRDAWRNLYGGVKNSAKTVVLQEGMQYQALSMNPNEIQMNETRQSTNSEICKLFNVPESMISTAANKYGSIEQNQLHFLKHTLAPILISLESAMDRALLLESEKTGGYFFRFDTSEIVRATEKERVDATVAAVQGGLFTINEARAKFDLPPMAEGDTTLITPGASTTSAPTDTPPADNNQGGTPNDQNGTQNN